MATLLLKEQSPFAQGGNRLCYVHPHDSSKCIKVRRPDFTLEDRRRKKGFPKNLKPLSSFDDNLDEFKIMADIERRFNQEVYHYISRCFRFEDTDMGKGLVSELILNSDNHVSHTLKQFIWDHGYTKETQEAVEFFCAGWERLGIPSRELLLHNIVVQLDEKRNILRLVVIDGLGSGNFLPDFLFTRKYLALKLKKKTDRLKARINTLLDERNSSNQFPGYHGRLLKDEAVKKNQL